MVKKARKNNIGQEQEIVNLKRELREKNRELESSKFRYKEKKYAGRKVEEEVKQSKQETENIKKTFAKELEEKELLIGNLETERESLEEYIIDNLVNHSEYNEQIIKKIEERMKEEEKEDAYWGFEKPEELLKDIKDGKLIETTITILKKGDQDAITHLKAIKVSEIKNKNIANDLRKEVAENKKKWENAKGKIEKKDLQISELQREIQQLKTNLEKANKTIEKKEQQNNELQKQIEKQNKEKTLKRKRDDTQQKGEKKPKLQKSGEGKESQELIDNIEIPAKWEN